MNRKGMTKYLVAEMCETINDHWGFEGDLNYKSPKNPDRELCFSIKVGATICSISDRGHRGTLIHMSKGAAETHRTMDIFGEAIYERKPYPTKSLGNSFILKGDNRLYIFRVRPSALENENVTASSRRGGCYAFNVVKDTVKTYTGWITAKRWNSCRRGEMLSVNFSAQSSGMSFAYV